MQNNQPRVFITGGAGYVGSALSQWLADLGFGVTILDCFAYGNVPPDDFPATIHRGDVRDRALLAKLIPGHQFVIHLAFLSVDSDYTVAPEIARDVNRMGLETVLDICGEAKVERFIFPSSCSVYGRALSSQTLEEDAPREALSAYGQYKIECEDSILERTGFTRSIFRFATICGPSPRQRLDLTVNRMTTEAFHKGVVSLYNPERIRPAVHIRDACRLYAEALTAPNTQVDGEIYNVAFENLTVAETAEIVISEIPASLIHHADGADQRSYRVSSEKLRKKLCFTNTSGTREAVRELIADMKSGRLPDALTSPKYYNKQGQILHDWSLKN